MQGWCKIKMAAKYSGVSPRTFRSWLKSGLKHSRLPSGTILINYSDVDKYIDTFAVENDEVDEIVNSMIEEMKQ